MLKINGKKVAAAGMTLSAYLEKENYQTARIVVERNEEIVPKDAYAQTVLADGDIIEIVNFVGGG